MSDFVFANIWQSIIYAVTSVWSWFYNLVPTLFVNIWVSLIVLIAIISLIIRPFLSVRGYNAVMSKHFTDTYRRRKD